MGCGPLKGYGLWDMGEFGPIWRGTDSVYARKYGLLEVTGYHRYGYAKRLLASRGNRDWIPRPDALPMPHNFRFGRCGTPNFNLFGVIADTWHELITTSKICPTRYGELTSRKVW